MKRKLVMLTAYDYPTAKIVDEVGVDYILVGDSLGMVVLGYPDTKSVTLTDMLHHTKAVARAVKKSVVIGDMPIGTYKTPKQAVINAKRFLAIGAHAVKIEGNKPKIIKALTAAHVKVMGHVGLLPQTAAAYRVQGKDEEAAEHIYRDAQEVAKAGAFAVVLECIPEKLAKKITASVAVPTIGIGAGPHCSGQVLVFHDLVGLSDFQGKFVKQYANMKGILHDAVAAFKKDVITKKFPKDEHSFH